MSDLANLIDRISAIERELESIKERNLRVEKDKSWEGSKTRVLSILVITYFLMCLIFYIINVNSFWINAIIPSLGYLLSTQSLPMIKNIWLKLINPSLKLSRRTKFKIN